MPRKRKSLAERFWPKVDKSGGPDACWLWKASRYSYGYGQIGTDVRCVAMPAHRAAWIVTHGPIPPEMQICHKCDNPPCVNPAHLFIGTRSDNMQDSLRKGRLKTQPARDAMARKRAAQRRAQ